MWQRFLLAAASAIVLTGGALLLGQAANAALVDVPETGSPGRLVLSSDPTPAQFLELSPGDPSYWSVAARLDDADRAELSLELRKSGALVEHPRGLVMTVDRCDAPWEGLDAGPGETPSCASGSAHVTTATPADDYVSSSPDFELRPLTAGSPEYLLITLSVEDSAAAMADDSLMGLLGEMGVGITAVTIDGIPVPPGPPDGGGGGGGVLSNTGGDWLAAGAFASMTSGALGLGVALLRLGRRRPAPARSAPARSLPARSSDTERGR
jgi:hypothetical protein